MMFIYKGRIDPTTWMLHHRLPTRRKDADDIASSEHEGVERIRDSYANPRRITVSNSPNPLVFRWGYKNTENVLC